jgi:hypothetical protein
VDSGFAWPWDEDPHRAEASASAANDEAVRKERALIAPRRGLFMGGKSRKASGSAHLSGGGWTALHPPGPTRSGAIRRAGQRVAPSTDSSSTKGVGPPAVPLKAGTDEGLLKLLFVPSGPPTAVPVKPGTLDGLFRLEFVPSAPPVTVPVKPVTVDGLLKLAFRVLPSAGTAAFEVALVLEPAPVDVVVVALAGVPATDVAPPALVVTAIGAIATVGGAMPEVGVADGVATTEVAVVAVGATVPVGPMTPTIGATFDGMPVAPPEVAGVVVAAAVPVGPMTPTIGATFDGMPVPS